MAVADADVCAGVFYQLCGFSGCRSCELCSECVGDGVGYQFDRWGGGD